MCGLSIITIIMDRQDAMACAFEKYEFCFLRRSCLPISSTHNALHIENDIMQSDLLILARGSGRRLCEKPMTFQFHKGSFSKPFIEPTDKLYRVASIQQLGTHSRKAHAEIRIPAPMGGRGELASLPLNLNRLRC